MKSAKLNKKYFKHYSDERNSEKLLKLRSELGMEGYGIYFALLEKLMDCNEHRLATDYSLLAFELSTSTNTLRKVVELYDLFDVTRKEASFSSKRIKNEVEHNSKISQKRTNSIRKRWEYSENQQETDESDTNVIQMYYKCNTNVLQMKYNCIEDVDCEPVADVAIVSPSCRDLSRNCHEEQVVENEDVVKCENFINSAENDDKEEKEEKEIEKREEKKKEERTKEEIRIEEEKRKEKEKKEEITALDKSNAVSVNENFRMPEVSGCAASLLFDVNKNFDENQEEKDEKCELINYDGLIRYWNIETKGVFGELRSIENNRRLMVKARIKEHGKRQFSEVICRAAKSEFLKNSNWFNFDWMIRPNNFDKISAGNYDNREPQVSENKFNKAPKPEEYTKDW